MRFFYYIREIAETLQENVVDNGITNDLFARDSVYRTGEYRYYTYLKVYEILENNYTNEKLRHFEKCVLFIFKELNVYGGGAREIFKTSILFHIENLLNEMNIKFKLLNDNEIQQLKDEYNNSINYEEFHPSQDLIDLKKKYLKKFPIFDINLDEDLTNYLRNYQEIIINYIYNYLLNNLRISLQLATGAGKSIISYHVINKLIQNVIVIFAPLKTIVEQNIDFNNKRNNKYTQYIKNKNVYIYNYSETFDKQCLENTKLNDKNDNVYIIGCCNQSKRQLYDFLYHKYEKQQIDIRSIFLWIDESHESWMDINNEDNSKWLCNNQLVQYTLFTSATQDRKIIKNNQHIYGEFYNPYTIGYFIAHNWLCPILPKIQNGNVEKNNVINEILNCFNEENRKSGLVFNNNMNNAVKLFIEHFIKYIKNETTIKPFLLISDEDKILKATQKEEINNEFIKLGFNILDLSIQNLRYNYQDIEDYEKYDNCISYIVKKYSVGYDNENIDYICFANHKQSYTDITQSIGRGYRINPKDINKKLIVHLMVNPNNENVINDYNEFSDIYQVLKWLIEECEVPFSTIINNIKPKPKPKPINHNIGKFDNNGDDDSTRFIENFKNYYMKMKRISYDKAKLLISEYKELNDIEYLDIEGYNKLALISLELPINPNEYFNKSINWLDYLGIDTSNWYQTVNEAQQMINKYLRENEEFDNITNKYELHLKLSELDNKFPYKTFWKEFYNTDINNIIILNDIY
jgi:hypothetical protein